MNSDPNAQIDAALSQAVHLLRGGRLAEAETICRQVLAAAPAHGKAWQVLGMVAHQAGQPAAAVECLHRAATYAPGQADILAGLAESLRKVGRIQEAVAVGREAVRLSPDVAEFHFGLGNALRDAGDVAGAEAEYAQAVRITPNHASAWFNLGNVQASLGRLPEALTSFQRAVNADPRHMKAWTNLAQVAIPQGLLGEAERAYRQAILLAPDVVGLRGGLANALLTMGRIEEAVDAYRADLGQGIDRPVTRSNLLLALNYSGRVTPEQLSEEHRAWGQMVESRVAPLPAVEKGPSAPMRVGFVSPDFRDHPVWKWLEPVFRHRDRERFEFVCYSSGDVVDGCTETIRSLASGWRDVAKMSDADAAALVRRDGIDVLVDLAGHTSGNRLPLFALKPAPVQATYLGYPNTTGLTRIDYRLTDVHADPPGTADGLHTERLLRLPRHFLCYQPPGDAPEVSALPALANGYVTFGSFNNLSKVSATTFDLWAGLLRELPGSRLLLKPSSLTDAAVRERVLGEFGARGVGPWRIDLLERLPGQAAHLAVYHKVDIALDTFPYHGTTTTADALWMGVPVVTLAGTEHRSRVGVSLLRSAGLPDLIADSPGAYARTALGLADDLPALSELRVVLRDRLRRAPLTDGVGFTRDFQQVLEEMTRGPALQPRP